MEGGSADLREHFRAAAGCPLDPPGGFGLNARMSEERYEISVSAEASWLPEQSDPDEHRYAFAYTITITNTCTVPARLLTRHWIISNANGDTEEVRGEGVVGEQPRLEPGESFRYTSGAVLETPVGTMHGTYQMQADDGTGFDAVIPAFTLSMPHSLH